LDRIVKIEGEQLGTCAYNALTAGERVELITTPPKAQTPINAQVGPAILEVLLSKSFEKGLYCIN
jgi:hypothetical protein